MVCLAHTAQETTLLLPIAILYTFTLTGEMGSTYAGEEQWEAHNWMDSSCRLVSIGVEPCKGHLLHFHLAEHFYFPLLSNLSLIFRKFVIEAYHTYIQESAQRELGFTWTKTHP